jgi:hypothetical protein
MKFTCLVRAGALRASLALALGSAALAQPKAPAGNPASASRRAVNALSGSATLTYSEPVGEAPAPVTGSGGLVGGVNTVTSAIANAGKGKREAKARFAVTVTPKLQRGATPQAPAIVTLEVRETAWEVDGELPENSKAALAADRAAVLAQLAQWRRTLTPDQLATLDRGEAVDFIVAAPFAAPTLLSHARVKVGFGHAAPPVQSIALRAARGGELIVGVPAVVEVTWKSAYTEPACQVRLNAGGRELTVTAQNTGDNLTFRSAPFLPYPAEYDDGLPVPTARPTGAGIR